MRHVSIHLHMCEQRHRERERERDTERHRETGSQIDRQIDRSQTERARERPTNRERARERERERERERCIHTVICTQSYLHIHTCIYANIQTQGSSLEQHTPTRQMHLALSSSGHRPWRLSARMAGSNELRKPENVHAHNIHIYIYTHIHTYIYVFSYSHFRSASRITCIFILVSTFGRILLHSIYRKK